MIMELVFCIVFVDCMTYARCRFVLCVPFSIC